MVVNLSKVFNRSVLTFVIDFFLYSLLSVYSMAIFRNLTFRSLVDELLSGFPIS